MANPGMYREGLGTHIQCYRVSKITNEVGRIDYFLDLARKSSFLQTKFDIFDIQ